MDENSELSPLTEKVLKMFILIALLYGAWNGVIWLNEYLAGLTPVRLALLSLWMSGVPFLLMFIFALVQENGAMQGMGMLTMVALSYITIPGLLISALWFLATRSI